MHMREVKSELRVLANKIEEQNETPAQLRARVQEIIRMLDDIDAGEEASQESEASYGEMWQDWFIGGRGWIGRGGGIQPAKRQREAKGKSPWQGWRGQGWRAGNALGQGPIRESYQAPVGAIF